MTNFIVAFYLLLQAAGGGEQGTVKPADADGGSRRVDAFRQEDLDALLRKVDLLESELRELKKRTPNPEEKPKSQDTKPSGQNPPPKAQKDGAKPNPQDQDEEKRKQLEEEFRKALGEEKQAPKMNTPVSPGIPIGGGASLKLIDIAFDLLAVGGTSTATEDEMRLLESGGHDPKNRGFTLQNAELTFSGVVDPSLQGRNPHVHRWANVGTAI